MRTKIISQKILIIWDRNYRWKCEDGYTVQNVVGRVGRWRNPNFSSAFAFFSEISGQILKADTILPEVKQNV